MHRCPARGEAGTLAYAADCQRDQMDRPTFGSINFCPHAVPSSVDDSYQLAVHTTIHELMHAIGFSARSWPLFRDAFGSPMTPRDPVFPHTPASAFSMCVSPVSLCVCAFVYLVTSVYWHGLWSQICGVFGWNDVGCLLAWPQRHHKRDGGEHKRVRMHSL
jgi:hypothetical protein